MVEYRQCEYQCNLPLALVTIHIPMVEYRPWMIFWEYQSNPSPNLVTIHLSMGEYHPCEY